MNELRELLLRAPALTLAVAESVTAGRLQSAISSRSGASDYFVGGLTAYRIDQKVKLLGVDRAKAEAVDCVSAEIAGQMAQGACALFGATVALSTTGYAEPAPERGVERPFAWWGLARPLGDGRFLIETGRIEPDVGMSRTDAQEAIAAAALTELLRHLRELRSPAGSPLF